MKIAVTGANGYIGRGVVRKLTQDGIEVVAVDIGIVDEENDKVTKVTKDIFELENPYEELGKPDVLVHLAWRDGFKHNSQKHVDDLTKHYFFLKKMIESGIKRVCVVGTVHEVGYFEGCVNEKTPTNPMSLYGIAKNTLRQWTELLCIQNNCIFQWIRGFYIVGNVENGCSIFSKIAHAEREEKTEFPFTHGTNKYDFIEYEQFVGMLAAVVEQDEVNGIINCCSGVSVSLGERVETFLKEMQYKIRLCYGVFPERDYDSKEIWGDTSKIDEIMKKRCEIAFETEN